MTLEPQLADLGTGLRQTAAFSVLKWATIARWSPNGRSERGSRTIGANCLLELVDLGPEGLDILLQPLDLGCQVAWRPAPAAGMNRLLRQPPAAGTARAKQGNA